MKKKMEQEIKKKKLLDSTVWKGDGLNRQLSTQFSTQSGPKNWTAHVAIQWFFKFNLNSVTFKDLVTMAVPRNDFSIKDANDFPPFCYQKCANE